MPAPPIDTRKRRAIRVDTQRGRVDTEPPPLPQTPPVPDADVLRAHDRELARQRLEAAREARRRARHAVAVEDLPDAAVQALPVSEAPAAPAETSLERKAPVRLGVLLATWVLTPALIKFGLDKEMVYILLGLSGAFMGLDTLRPSGHKSRA